MSSNQSQNTGTKCSENECLSVFVVSTFSWCTNARDSRLPRTRAVIARNAEGLPHFLLSLRGHQKFLSKFVKNGSQGECPETREIFGVGIDVVETVQSAQIAPMRKGT